MECGFIIQCIVHKAHMFSKMLRILVPTHNKIVLNYFQTKKKKITKHLLNLHTSYLFNDSEHIIMKIFVKNIFDLLLLLHLKMFIVHTRIHYTC